MPRTGYLAAIDNVPPLIFRFQVNPEILSNKKSFGYQAAQGFGQWGFDQTKAGTGVIGSLAGLYKDIKEWGSLLSRVKPLEPKEGEPQTISLEFKLYADLTSAPAPTEGPSGPGGALLEEASHYGGSIEPDLAVLRSFMHPSWDMFDLFKMFGGKFPCPTKPPEVSFVYGGISMTCVMTDLNIKITAFKPEDGSPLRAEVDLTLKEQTYSTSPLSQLIKREINVAKSYARGGSAGDTIGALADDVKNIYWPF